MPLKIAILASGSGTNAQAMIDRAKAGILDVEIVLILSNRPDALVLKRAENAGIACLALDHKLFPSRAAHEAKIVEVLRANDCQLVVLAGYMRIMGPTFMAAYAGRAVNLHPALLPSFPGTHGAEDALRYGVKIGGASVHFLDENMDTGPLIIQAALPANAGEEVEVFQNRIHSIEHRIYPQAVQWFAEGRLHLRGRQVYLRESAKKKIAPPENTLIWPPLEEGF